MADQDPDQRIAAAAARAGSLAAHLAIIGLDTAVVCAGAGARPGFAAAARGLAALAEGMARATVALDQRLAVVAAAEAGAIASIRPEPAAADVLAARAVTFADGLLAAAAATAGASARPVGDGEGVEAAPSPAMPSQKVRAAAGRVRSRAASVRKIALWLEDDMVALAAHTAR